MFCNRRQSILLLTPECIARFDVAKGKLCGVWRQSRASNDSLPRAMAIAASLAPARLGETWILASDFWSSRITLAQDVVQSIPSESLEQAIAFELEYDSGLDPFATRVGFVPIRASEDNSQSREQETDTAVWWTLQLENSVIEEASKIVAGRRGSLAGFSIPTGLTGVPFDAATTPSMAAGHLEQFTDEQLGSHALDWLSVVRTDTPSFPVLRSSKNVRHPWHGKQLVGLLAACAFALCSGHYLMNRSVARRVQAELEELQTAEPTLREEIKELELKVSQATAQQTQTAEQFASAQQRLVQVQRQQAIWNDGRQFPATLMQALHATADPSRCILNIAYTRQTSIEVQGLAVDNEDVLALAVRLEELLPSEQWTVQPPKMSLPVSGGPVHFTVSVRHAGHAITQVAGGRHGS